MNQRDVVIEVTITLPGDGTADNAACLAQEALLAMSLPSGFAIESANVTYVSDPVAMPSMPVMVHARARRGIGLYQAIIGAGAAIIGIGTMVSFAF